MKHPHLSDPVTYLCYLRATDEIRQNITGFDYENHCGILVVNILFYSRGTIESFKNAFNGEDVYQIRCRAVQGRENPV